MFSRILIVLGAIALSQSLAGYAVEGEFDVDFVTDNNMHLQFSRYNLDIEKELSKELRDKINDAAIKVVEYLDKLVEEMLTKGVSAKRWISVGKELKEIVSLVPKPAIELARKYGYNEYIKDFARRLMVNSKVVGKKLTKDTANSPEWLINEAHQALHAVVETIKVSPASIYLRWPEGFVNDSSAEQYVYSLTGRLSYHGYSHVLTVGHAALKAVLLYDKFKSKIWG